MEAPEHLQVMGFEKGKACGDHFMVEDLLDFSNGGAEEGEGEGEGEEELAFDSSSSIVLQNSAESSSAVAPIEYCSSTSPISGPREPHFLGEDLCVPYDELAELEWLSHFVEDSFSADSSSHKLQALPSSTNTITPITTPHKPSTLTATTPANTTANTSNLATTSNLTTTTNAISYTPPSPSPPLFTTDPPVRCARSKRCRSAPRDWASRLLVLTPPTNPIPPEASLLRPPPTPTTHDNHQSSTSSNCPPLPSTKKHSKAPKKHTQQQHNHSNLFEPSLAPNPDGRKCLHCATEKTPQWRTGPMGPKTLCNACGVRYKSGRLVPEYRPAASPTFVLSKHSNSHRKVMELRRQKDLQLHHPPQRGGSSGDHHPTNGNGLFVGNHYRQQQHGAAGGGGDIGGGYCEESDDFLIHNHLGPDFRQLI